MNIKSWVTVTAPTVVLLGVGALLVPGVASATPEQDYLYDLRSNGIGGPDDQLLSLGRNACVEKAQAVSSDQSALNIKAKSSLDIKDATFLYESATYLICPG
jgi:Protein of unknown function (DUF732)